MKKREEGRPMTSGFQQQNPWAGFTPPRTATLPRHGQQPDKSCVRPPPPRVVKPRPGH